MKATWVSSTQSDFWQMREAHGSLTCASLRLTGTTGQTMAGFGGCFNELGWDALGVLPDGDRNAVLAALFGPEGDGCRFNMGRVPIGASDYALQWYSHDEADGDYGMERFSVERDRRYLLPYIKAAMGFRPDLWLFASPWSPPTWMKTHRVFNYGVIRWQPEILHALALYFLRFVRAYREEGVEVRQVHVQNEPAADQKFPSCRWMGERLRDFIRDYLGPLFEREGEECEIWLGTLNADNFDEFIVSAMIDDVCRRFIGGVGLQWAGKSIIQRIHAAWPELRLMQTENECGDGKNTWQYAHYVFALLWHYLTNGAEAYCYWNMVLPVGGESTWGWRQNSMVCVDKDRREVAYNPEFHVMRHFSRFVQPGAVRLDVSGPWAGNALVFRNPDGAAVVVAANPLAQPRTLIFQADGGNVACEAEPCSFNTLVVPG